MLSIQEFLNESYTAYHTVKNVKTELEKHGFAEFKEGIALKKGGKYYVTENGSALIAFSIGESDKYAFNIAVSHTDSPCLKIKGNTLLNSEEGKKLNVEKYGGLILYSMLDIPLKIAGRVVKKADKKLEAQTAESDFFVNIPSLAIHHNPDVNEKCHLNVQTDMCPLLGEGTDVYSIFGSDVAEGDLFVVPAVKAFSSGRNDEFLVSPRLDNLTSVYAGLYGIINSTPHGVAVAYMADNEEIGSLTKQGAWSSFLTDTLKRINSALGFGEEEFASAKKNGFILSTDNGHAVHQAHPENSDVAEKVVLNGGIVIKHHVNYSSDGVSSAIFKSILENSGIKFQDYYNRSDLRCGSTVGLVCSSLLSMKACDIGLAQLAMHSAVETVGIHDIERMNNALTAFFNSSIDDIMA